MAKKNTDKDFKEKDINDPTSELYEFEYIHLSLSNERFLYEKIELENFPRDKLSMINGIEILSFHDYPYYMHKPYEKIQLLGLNFLLTKLSKKSATLICVGTGTTYI